MASAPGQDGRRLRSEVRISHQQLADAMVVEAAAPRGRRVFGAWTRADLAAPGGHLMMKAWFSLKDLAAAPGVPSKVQNIRARAVRESWLRRPRRGKGGGFEYHISSLPAVTQSAIRAAEPADTPNTPEATNPPPITSSSRRHFGIAGGAGEARLVDGDRHIPPAGRRAFWQAWERASRRQKAEARRRAALCERIAAMVAGGLKVSVAVRMVAADETTRLSERRLQQLWDAVRTMPASNWLPALVSGHLRGGHDAAECDPRAWDMFLADYLRLEKPAFSACYRRVVAAAELHRWAVPSERTLARRVERLPTTMRVFKREGEVALKRLYPPLKRSVKDLSAMEWLNGDGYLHNVFVRWPDGRVARPKTWFFQDVFSRKILAWRVDETEHSGQIRLAFGDVVERFGVPRHLTVDNTRAVANKFLTGGVPNRYRFRINEDEDPVGMLSVLGVKVHWTSVTQAGERVRGWGQAKPVERAFGVGGFGEVVDKHPKFAGAFAGEDTTRKPENYGAAAVALDEFRAVLDEEIAAWNARPGRRSEMAGGVKSFDQVFAESYAAARVVKGTPEQRRLWLLETEAVKVQRDATVVLKAGGVAGRGMNRYHADFLYQMIGKRVVVRFDPDALHGSVHIYKREGPYIGEAACVHAAGFGDADAARKVNRARREMVKATKKLAASEIRMDLDEVAARLGSARAATRPADEAPPAGVVEILPRAVATPRANGNGAAVGGNGMTAAPGAGNGKANGNAGALPESGADDSGNVLDGYFEAAVARDKRRQSADEETEQAFCESVERMFGGGKK